MSIIDRSGEEIARIIDRRKFLKRAAIVIFSFATASAISLDRFSTARANNPYCSFPDSHKCTCDVNGRYCTSVSPSYCVDGDWQCNSQAKCYYDPTIEWSSGNGNGCWCTDVCEDGCHEIYYVCCDCICPHNVKCSCTQVYIVEVSSRPNC